MAGFSSAEGCFFVNIKKSATHKLKVNVQLEFQLIQHVRDEQLMRSFSSILDCGKVYSANNISKLRVTKFLDLTDKIIPFFKKYPIMGEKYLNFEDLCRVAELIKGKKHLTEEGIEEIRQIKAGMNTLRKSNEY